MRLMYTVGQRSEKEVDKHLIAPCVLTVLVTGLEGRLHTVPMWSPSHLIQLVVKSVKLSVVSDYFSSKWMWQIQKDCQG